jgi:hypothetical protein
MFSGQFHIFPKEKWGDKNMPNGQSVRETNKIHWHAKIIFL